MAFVALANSAITFIGKSGKPYVISFTSTGGAVGMVTFTQDGQKFWKLPEDCRIADAYVDATVNVADYLSVYLDSIIKPHMQINVAQVKAATTVPHLAPSGWIRGGTQFAMYYYSA